MELHRRDCLPRIRLVPCGAGWTHVYADFGEGELYFIISNVLCSGFEALMRALYFLYPAHHDPQEGEPFIEYRDDDYIPWKASFTWDEEGSESVWTLEREPTEAVDFDLRVHIQVEGDEVTTYDYTVPYRDLCYAVADACTRALKKHGLRGYHTATYGEDVNLCHLLFLKAIALDCPEALTLVYPEERGEGERSDFSREMELLLYDM